MKHRRCHTPPRPYLHYSRHATPLRNPDGGGGTHDIIPSPTFSTWLLPAGTNLPSSYIFTAEYCLNPRQILPIHLSYEHIDYDSPCVELPQPHFSDIRDPSPPSSKVSKHLFRVFKSPAGNSCPPPERKSPIQGRGTVLTALNRFMKKGALRSGPSTLDSGCGSGLTGV